MMSHEHSGKMGAGGFCVCVSCGYRKPHERGVPCMEEKCPKCGKVLFREGSDHYKMVMETRKKEGNGRV